jgi:hypothetical protein
MIARSGMEERAGKGDIHDNKGTRMTSPQSTSTSSSGMMELAIIWPLKSSNRPYCLDPTYHLGVVTLRLHALNQDARKVGAHVRIIRKSGRKPSKGRACRGRGNLRSSSSPKKAETMASSSGNNPTMEERITGLEENVQKLRSQLISLDDFLQNLDSEAGRRMEMLENDIIHTKSGLC